MTEALDIALVQLNAPANQAAALAHAEPLVREAAAAGAKFILTPEGTNFLEQRRENRAKLIVRQNEDPVVQGLSRLAAELGVWPAIQQLANSWRGSCTHMG